MKLESLGLCPCGKNIYVSEKPRCVGHDYPFCKEFENLDVVAFMTYVRRSRGIPDPPEDERRKRGG